MGSPACVYSLSRTSAVRKTEERFPEKFHAYIHATTDKKMLHLSIVILERGITTISIYGRVTTSIFGHSETGETYPRVDETIFLTGVSLCDELPTYIANPCGMSTIDRVGLAQRNVVRCFSFHSFPTRRSFFNVALHYTEHQSSSLRQTFHAV